MCKVFFLLVLLIFSGGCVNFGGPGVFMPSPGIFVNESGDTMTGQLELPAGSGEEPALKFTSMPGLGGASKTGIHIISTNVFGPFWRNDLVFVADDKNKFICQGGTPSTGDCNFMRPVIIPDDPWHPYFAANKGYVDGVVDTYLLQPADANVMEGAEIASFGGTSYSTTTIRFPANIDSNASWEIFHDKGPVVDVVLWVGVLALEGSGLAQVRWNLRMAGVAMGKWGDHGGTTTSLTYAVRDGNEYFYHKIPGSPLEMDSTAHANTHKTVNITLQRAGTHADDTFNGDIMVLWTYLKVEH